jgi:thiol-disulfide isomerase/thioredoxin
MAILKIFRESWTRIARERHYSWDINHTRGAGPYIGRRQCAELVYRLDEELTRLPARYRAPVVLCDLGGLTRRETAVRIGVPEGTVSSRLARGRALLRERLSRRGLGLTAGAVVPPRVGTAAVPERLAVSTMHAAMRFVADSTVAGAVTTSTVSLADGVLKAMLRTRVKVAAIALGLGAAIASVVVGAAARDPDSATTGAPAVQNPPAGAPTVRWAKDLPSALAEARRQGKPVFASVEDETCAYCRGMNEKVYPAAEVVEALKKFVAVRVVESPLNLTDASRIKKYKFFATPAFVILDPAGSLVDRFLGFRSPNALVARLEDAERDYRAFPALERTARDHPEDPVARGRYAGALAARGRTAEALAMVERLEREHPQASAARAPAYIRLGQASYEASGGACEVGFSELGSFDRYRQGSFEAARW